MKTDNRGRKEMSDDDKKQTVYFGFTKRTIKKHGGLFNFKKKIIKFIENDKTI